LLKLLLSPQRTYPNLFDAHPPFQIDGNFGATAAIAECLLQSHRGRVNLLPALPRAWPQGRVSGLRARGGFELDVSWSEGRLERVSVLNHSGEPGKLVYRNESVPLRMKKGQRLNFEWRDDKLKPI
jgi:alpha-L-fucosidase 2